MPQETKRRAVLHALQILDTAPEPEFDTIVDGAKQVFGAMSAFIALVDQNRLWFKARCNLANTEAERETSFCKRAIEADSVLVIPDTHADPRFADHPMVTGAPFIRFYAGVPLHARANADGEPVAIGTLCVIDDQPRHVGPPRIDMLKGMALVVEALLELRRTSRESFALALERHKTLVACERTSRQLVQAERMANIGSWRLDLQTEKVSWSDQTYVIHALTPGDGMGLANALDFYPPADRARVAGAVADCAEHGRSWDLEVDFVDAKGMLRRVHAIGEPERHDGKVVALIGVIQDITERYRLEQALRQVADTDELTGLANRRAFYELLDATIVEATAAAEPLAVVLLDLDRFKEVNDRLGHAAGDEVLRAAAARLRATGEHAVARLGGDEFVLLLRGPAAAEGLERAVARLLGALRQVGPITDGAIAVSATLGASRLAPGLTDRSALLKAADRALYRAKHARRGTGAIDGRPGLIAARDEGAGLASAA